MVIRWSKRRDGPSTLPQRRPGLSHNAFIGIPQVYQVPLQGARPNTHKSSHPATGVLGLVVPPAAALLPSVLEDQIFDQHL